MMDMKKLGHQTMEFYKTAFDNAYDALMLYQEQMQRLGSMYWGQMVNLPEEAKKDLTEWMTVYKKNCVELKKMVDDNFKGLETSLA